MLKKVGIVFRETNSEVGIFLAMKYVPLSNPLPPSLKYLSEAPGVILEIWLF